MSEPALPGFRPPRQTRSRRTLERIAGATGALLAEREPSEITVQDVVARARTSVGAFYTRFESKDVAVAFVRERFWADLRERWRKFLAPETWRGVRTEAAAAEVIRRFCRLLLADDQPIRAFYLDLLRGAGAGAIARLRWLDGEIAALVADLLVALAPDERPGGGRSREASPRSSGGQASDTDRRELAEEGFRRVISAVRDHLLFGGAGRGGPGAETDRALILSLTRMYSASLGLEPPASYAALLALCAEARRR